ncbi:MAG: hypothetical protein BA868_07620 [Desulfobacterales bacterium C00003106]|jgi:hypothetical protein|nr:MAG: hypothetical protein BA868_07620 [Desulfobacterales bacterium C00003106]
MGSDFNASQDVVIPIGMGDSTRRNFPTLLGAMAQIQQFFVIEKSGQEIPDEFLTIQGKFNFFKVGCGSGFIEGLSFALLAALVVPILSDQKLMMSVAHYFPLAQSKVFLHTLNCFPVLLTCGLCCFLSRYRIGTLTRKAVDAFLFGRLMSLVMKGIIIFTGLTWLSGAITESSAWSAAKWVSLKQYGPAREIYRIILNTKPYLDYMATETIVIFTVAIIVPFITVWGVSLLRNLKARRQRASWNG